jgi:two-component system chemotaxis response regulator CheY
MSKKILITDDAQFMRFTLKKLLQSNGYDEVIEASNGQEAVDSYDAHRPDLVLMDITMPIMNGIDATRTIKNRHPDARVIICSAMGQKSLILEAIQAGAKDFIVKPFQPDRVLESIKKLIG